MGYIEELALSKRKVHSIIQVPVEFSSAILYRYSSAVLPNGDAVFAPYMTDNVAVYKSNVEANQEISFSRYIKQH